MLPQATAHCKRAAAGETLSANMGLSLRVDPIFLDGDLVDESDDTGLQTEALVALLSDARVDDNVLGAGRVNRGYWADSVTADGEQVGSSLWLLEDVTPSEQAAALASEYVEAALQPLVRDGRVARIEPGVPETVGQHLSVSPRLVLPDGSVVELGGLRVN